ncbi:TM2 domain-containing protein [Treponema socranskii]|jgi:TM2 domain|uniref:TM2 domain-containing protein n=1 Tax=Treponema socranskii TaxID=53419 RepID=UPI0028ED35F2|nr:TM2 domain-containing protein [Treponema socranskii]
MKRKKNEILGLNSHSEISTEMQEKKEVSAPPLENNAVQQKNMKIQLKSRTTALLLCLFLGWSGAHKFYVGRIKGGLFLLICFIFYIAITTLSDIFNTSNSREEIYLLVIPCLLIISFIVIIDFFKILLGKFRDNDGLLIKNW